MRKVHAEKDARSAATTVPPVQSADRVLALLGLFDEQTMRLTPSQAGGLLGVHRSTASRLMATLERHRLLEVDRQAGGYVLGLGLVTLAGQVLSRYPVRDGGREIVRRLRDETGANVYLGVLDADEVVYIDQVSSPHVRLGTDWVGARQRLAAGVTGAVLLAFQPDAVVAELLAEARSEERDPARPRLDQALVARIRTDGHLSRIDPEVDDHAGVAVPIRDQQGEVVAALCLSTPTHRTDAEHFAAEMVPAALRAAARISEQMGHGLF